MLEKGVIIEHRQIAKDIFLLTLFAPKIATAAQAGQFVHIRCGKTFDPLLRRPFSFSSIDREGGTCSVIYEIRGRGTRLMADFIVGQEMDLLGPLGNYFALELVKPDTHVILVGGGIGAPPMASLAEALKQPGGAKVTVLLGAATGNKLLPKSIFEATGAEVFVATDDGTSGYHGFVTELLYDVVESEQGGAMEGDRPFQGDTLLEVAPSLCETSPIVVFACGPNGMLKAVGDYCLEKGIPCQLSLEEIMACGVGACQGCACKVKTAEGNHGEGSQGDKGSPGGAGFDYVRVCKEGPVFEAGEVVWDE